MEELEYGDKCMLLAIDKLKEHETIYHVLFF